MSTVILAGHDKQPAIDEHASSKALVNDVIQGLSATLGACKDGSRRRALDQLWLCQRRAGQKSTSNYSHPVTIVLWGSGYKLCLERTGFTDRARVDGLYCGMPGCGVLEPASCRCGRCMIPYCSEECQKRYVLIIARP